MNMWRAIKNFEHTIYADSNERWASLDIAQQQKLLENARYETFTSSRYASLLTPCLIMLVLPVLVVLFVVLPYTLWPSLWIIPFGAMVTAVAGSLLFAALRALVIKPALLRLMAEDSAEELH